MQELEKHIVNANGDKGREWFRSLPEVVTILSEKWQLRDVCEIEGMSWNYVISAYSGIYGDVIIKIGYALDEVLAEVRALQHFDGRGMIRLLAVDEGHHAIMLKRAKPGMTLNDLCPEKFELALRHYISTVQDLYYTEAKKKETFPHIRDWLKAMDQVKDNPKMPQDILRKAMALRDELLSSAQKEYVLHGDLHYGNVISDRDGWVAIDPKGVVGELVFEVAAPSCFEWILGRNIPKTAMRKKFLHQVTTLSEKLAIITQQRIANWLFVRCVLSASWMIEDDSEPNRFLKILYGLFDI